MALEFLGISRNLQFFHYMSKEPSIKVAGLEHEAKTPTHLLILQDSGQSEYYTPPKLVAAARLAMGGIDLDPASSGRANALVKATKIFTIEDNGLTQPWSGRVWMNHPFNRKWNAAWINKLISEYQEGRIAQACCITYASTSEAWFRPLLRWPQCFLAGRTHYLLPDGTVLHGSTKGSVVTYVGKNLPAFAAAFGGMGEIKILWTAPGT